MFVEKIDASWLKHPFWRSRFLINDSSKLREYSKAVFSIAGSMSPKAVTSRRTTRRQGPHRIHDSPGATAPRRFGVAAGAAAGDSRAHHRT
jgi:Domain of unknown function (DUF3391)